MISRCAADAVGGPARPVRSTPASTARPAPPRPTTAPAPATGRTAHGLAHESHRTR